MTLLLAIEARDKASAAINGIHQALEGAVTQLTKFAGTSAKQFQDIGRVATGLGIGMTGLALGMGAMAFSAAKAAGDFVQEMEMLHTQAGASEAEVKSMTSAVLALAPAVGVGPEALAQALFHVESAGFRGAQALDILKIAAEGAAVGHADLEATTNALVGIMATNIKDVHGAADAMGILNGIVGAGNMRLQDLVGAISTGVVPAAAQFGLTLHDVGAALATMTDMGTPAEEAATRLRMTFALMASPSGVAANALRDIGLSSTDLANAMRQPNGLLVALTMLKSHLEDSGLTAVEQSQVLTHAFGGGRSSAAIMMLINNLDRLKSKYGEIGAAGGNFGEAFQKTSEEMNFKLQQLHATGAVVVDEIGLALIPIVVKLLDAVLPIITALAKWIQAHEDLIGKIIPVVIVVTGLIGVLLTLFGIFALVAAGIAGMIAAWGALVAFVGVVVGVVALLGFWFIVIIVLIAAVVFAITHWSEIKKIAAEVWHNVTTTVGNAITNIWHAITAWVGNVLKTISGGLASVFSAVTGWVGNVWSAITGFFGRLLIAVETAWHSFTERPMYWVGFLIGWLIGSYIRLETDLLHFFVRLVLSAFNGAKNFVEAVIKWVAQLPGEIAKWLTQTETRVALWIAHTLAAGQQAGSGFLSAVIDWFKRLPGEVWNWLTNAVKQVNRWEIDLIIAAVHAAQSFAKAVTDELGKLPGQVYDIGKRIVEGLINGVKDMLGAAKKAVGDFAGGILGGLKAALGISSPSIKAQLEVGVPTGQGVITGLLDSLKRAQPQLALAVQPNALFGGVGGVGAPSAIGAPVMGGGQTIIFDFRGSQIMSDRDIDTLANRLSKLYPVRLAATGVHIRK